MRCLRQEVISLFLFLYNNIEGGDVARSKSGPLGLEGGVFSVFF